MSWRRWSHKNKKGKNKKKVDLKIKNVEILHKFLQNLNIILILAEIGYIAKKREIIIWLLILCNQSNLFELFVFNFLVMRACYMPALIN